MRLFREVLLYSTFAPVSREGVAWRRVASWRGGVEVYKIAGGIDLSALIQELCSTYQKAAPVHLYSSPVSESLTGRWPWSVDLSTTE